MKTEFSTDLNRKHGKYSRIERRLVKEIKEIKNLILFHGKIISQKFSADWEPASLLSNDRNNYIRLGILIESLNVEGWVECLIADYFIEPKKYSYRTKKYRLFERYILEKIGFHFKVMLLYQIAKIPPEIKIALNEIRKIRNTMVHREFPGMESTKEVIYNKKNILELVTFKKFLEDCKMVTNFLINKALYNRK